MGRYFDLVSYNKIIKDNVFGIGETDSCLGCIYLDIREVYVAYFFCGVALNNQRCILHFIAAQAVDKDISYIRFMSRSFAMIIGCNEETILYLAEFHIININVADKATSVGV